MKTRLDVACVERKLFESRVKAQACIMAGLVTVNGLPADKAGKAVEETDVIAIARPDCPYVSRGGFKLKGAIDNFKIDVKDKICLDVGAATGGFTDCFLQEGAGKVYAVDVGEGQLHEKIKNHPKVVFVPRTNARYLKPGQLPELPELAAIDVSFISLKLILGPVFNSTAPGARIIALIKPQFELQPRDLKKGIVRSDEARLLTVEALRAFIGENFKAVEEAGLMESPVKGSKGNIEFLWYLAKRLP
ncbi:MAG: TlyA family RNA methyltransferase [Elusimicrobiales bacterium]|jgi:23S rRNA (cytidine1920-2'-O)/16S rRNA (cytidine1409-2'-O)-methyltransferase